MEETRKVNHNQGTGKLYRDTNLKIIIIVYLIGLIGIFSIPPAFPKLAQALSVPPQNVGLLISVFTFPTVILGPILGVIADRLGRKKILVFSLILFGIAGSTCGFVSNFELLLTLRFIQGIGAASLLPLCVTLIGDLYSEQTRMAAMGYNYSVSSMGTAVYPIIGGLLAAIGWNYPFFLAVLAIPTALLVSSSLRVPRLQSELNLKEYFRNALKSISNRRFIGIFIGNLGTLIVFYGAFIPYIPIIIKDSFNGSTVTIGIILSIMTASITLASSQIGRLAKTFSELVLIQVSLLLYSLALVIVPFVQNIWLLLIPTVLFGIAFGLGFPSIQALTVRLAPKEYRAAVISVNWTVTGLGQTLGPVLMAVIFSNWGINSVFYVGAVFAIFVLGLFRYWMYASTAEV